MLMEEVKKTNKYKDAMCSFDYTLNTNISDHVGSEHFHF